MEISAIFNTVGTEPIKIGISEGAVVNHVAFDRTDWRVTGTNDRVNNRYRDHDRDNNADRNTDVNWLYRRG